MIALPSWITPAKSDFDLRKGLEFLINSHDQVGSFISSPAIEATPSLIATETSDSIPNIIITIHDIGEADGHHFIAMEYIDGDALREKVASSHSIHSSGFGGGYHIKYYADCRTRHN